MNKPIRRVAFVAMIMFALLLANGTYMMIFRQSRLPPAAEPPGAGCRVRPEPRSDLGCRKDRDRQNGPREGPLQVPACLS